jgi:hypothetical protein
MQKEVYEFKHMLSGACYYLLKFRTAHTYNKTNF